MTQDELFGGLRAASTAYQARNKNAFQNQEVMTFVAEVIGAIPEFLTHEPCFFERESVESLIRSLNGDSHAGIIFACWVWAKRIDFFDNGHALRAFIQKLEDKTAAELFVSDNIPKIVDALDWIEQDKLILPVQIMEKRLKWFEGQYKDLENKEAFKTFVEQAPKLMQHLETIKTLKAEVISLENTLKAQKTEFNFVGLNQGFENVRNKKLDELKPVNRFSWFLIFLILALPIGLGICFALPPVKGLEAHLLTAAPVFGLELLALYFYRVNLQHMRSIKAQIVQLELRQALCQFIQSYAEYSKEIKENNGAALDKFENLIFSGLAVNENQVPTTFDGLETLTNLIKSLQK